MKYIITKDRPRLMIKVEEFEKVGRQYKFYGQVIGAGEDPAFWVGQMFETPFLYKSGFTELKR